MSVMLGLVRLANPVMTASGTCGYCFELSDFVDLGVLAGFITKSITREERAGNPPQRTVETAAGMLNAIGLANVGLARFCSEKVPLLEKMVMPVFVNVAGTTIDDYVAVAQRLAELSAISGLELNISCPNVKEGGITFGVDPQKTFKLVSAVRKRCPQTMLIVKLTPNVTDIAQTARAAVEAGADALSLVNTSGADALSLVNTFVGMAIDIESRRAILANRTGGLSGPAIKPMAVHLVRQVYEKVAQQAGVPIIGMGGISCARDAIEFIIAGASAVAVGTAAMVNPSCLVGIVEGIKDYLIRHKIASVRELTGVLA